MTRRRTRALLVATFSSVIALPSIAHADPEPQAAPAPAVSSAPQPAAAPETASAEPTGFDYRVPMIVTDVALAGTLAGSWTLGRAEAISPGLAVGGVVGSYAAFVASGAVYHALFDTNSKVGMSVLVRSLAPPLFSSLVWASMHNSESRQCREDGIPSDKCNHDGAETGLIVGALIGMIGATVAEAAIVVPDGRKPPPAKRSAFTIAPTAGPTRGGGQIGVVATF